MLEQENGSENAWGSLQRSSRPLAVFKGPNSNGMAREGKQLEGGEGVKGMELETGGEEKEGVRPLP